MYDVDFMHTRLHHVNVFENWVFNELHPQYENKLDPFFNEYGLFMLSSCRTCILLSEFLQGSPNPAAVSDGWRCCLFPVNLTCLCTAAASVWNVKSERRGELSLFSIPFLMPCHFSQLPAAFCEDGQNQLFPVKLVKRGVSCWSRVLARDARSARAPLHHFLSPTCWHRGWTTIGLEVCLAR